MVPYNAVFSIRFYSNKQKSFLHGWLFLVYMGFSLFFSVFFVKITLSWCSRYSPGFQPAISSTVFPAKNSQNVPTRQGTGSSPYTGHGTGSSNLYSSPENDHNLHNSSFNCLTPSPDLSPSPDTQVRHWNIYVRVHSV
jgi:hypothetical protein